MAFGRYRCKTVALTFVQTTIFFKSIVFLGSPDYNGYSMDVGVVERRKNNADGKQKGHRSTVE